MRRSAKLAMLRVARVGGLFRLCRLLTRNKVRILCYHGGSIGDEDRFNPLLFCKASLLRKRLQWLQENGFTIVQLGDAVRMLGDQQVRPRLPTVMTFDDGWFSTYSVLLPVLDEYKVPATLYLSTEHYVDGWPNLDVAIAYLVWKAGLRQVCLESVAPSVDGNHDTSSAASRGLFASAVSRFLRQSCPERASVCAALESISVKLGVDASILDLESRRFDFVSECELRELAEKGWSIELHGHVHAYPLGRPDELRIDLEKCATEIRKAGLRAPSHYCYPSGEYDTSAHNVLADVGVASATTCRPGLVGNVDEVTRYYLPRFLDGENIDHLEFEAEMSGMMDFVRALSGRQRVLM